MFLNTPLSTDALPVSSVIGVLNGIFAEWGALTKTGAGTLTLAGPSIYTGATTIRNGTVVVGVSDIAATSGAFGTAASAILLGDGSTTSTNNIQISNGAFTLNRNITVGTSIFGGTITLNSGVPLTLKSTGTQATITGKLTGKLTGTGNINMTGTTGTVQLNGSVANDYVGTVTVSAGTLELKSQTGGNNMITGNVIISAGATLNESTVSNQIADAAAVTNNGGLYNLSSSSSEIIGTLAMTGGTVTTSSSILTLGAASVGTDVLTMTGGTITVGGASSAGSLRLNGNVSILSTSTQALMQASNGTTQANSFIDLRGATRTFNVATGSGAALNQELLVSAAVVNGTGTGSLTKSGTGTMIISGAVTISAGELKLGNAGALNSTAGSENAVTFGAATTGKLSLNGNSVVVASLNGSAVGPVVQNASGANVANATLTVGNSLNAVSSYAGLLQDGTGGAGNATLSGGTITINALSGLGGHFASTGGGTLTVADTVNSSVQVIERLGTVIFGGGALTVALVPTQARSGLELPTVSPSPPP